MLKQKSFFTQELLIQLKNNTVSNWFGMKWSCHLFSQSRSKHSFSISKLMLINYKIIEALKKDAI